MQLKVTTVEEQTLTYSERGEGKTVFFFPGGGASTTYYEHFLEDFAKEFHVITINYPGFDKAVATQSLLSIDYYTRCIAAAIQSFGFKENIVVTHSMGCGVILSVADKFPKLISKAVLMAPMLRQFPGTPQELATRVTLSAAQMRHHLKSKRVVPFIKKNVENAVESMKQLDMLTHRFSVPLETKAPMKKLVIIGGKDLIFPHTEQVKLLEKVHNKTVFTYADAGHDVMFSYTKEVIAQIRDFFAHKV